MELPYRRVANTQGTACPKLASCCCMVSQVLQGRARTLVATPSQHCFPLFTVPWLPFLLATPSCLSVCLLLSSVVICHLQQRELLLSGLLIIYLTKVLIELSGTEICISGKVEFLVLLSQCQCQVLICTKSKMASKNEERVDSC